MADGPPDDGAVECQLREGPHYLGHRIWIRRTRVEPHAEGVAVAATQRMETLRVLSLLPFLSYPRAEPGDFVDGTLSREVIFDIVEVRVEWHFWTFPIADDGVH